MAGSTCCSNVRITATDHTDASGPESYKTSGVRRGSGKATITGRLFSFEREYTTPRPGKRAWR
jgi:hypothetical protein